jgi:integrase
MPRIVDLLNSRGYELGRAENLGGRHVQAIAVEMVEMVEMGFAPKSMQSFWTELGYWADWIGKPGLVKPMRTYLPDVDAKLLKVEFTTRQSKSWSQAGLDIVKIIAMTDRLDDRLGCMIRLGLAFGLRRGEILCLHVHKADLGRYLRVFPGDGPKSGRPRDIPVEHPWKRGVLDFVKARIPKTQYLGWQHTPAGKYGRLNANEDRFERFRQKLGITAAQSGVTARGMRAEYSENIALLEGMLPATLRGRADQMDADDLRLIQEGVMERMGHSRISVAAAYYGSFRRFPAPEEPGDERDTADRSISSSCAGSPEQWWVILLISKTNG